MRTMTLLAGLMLATALVAFAPTADASNGCIDVKGGAQVCLPDRCAYQSDCCDATGFWCPEHEDS